MISLTAAAQGYYRVFVNDEQVSQHVQEREAAERVTNEKLKDPSADVYYDHDYKVTAEYTPPEIQEVPINVDPMNVEDGDPTSGIPD
jgi:hypothetical protein